MAIAEQLRNIFQKTWRYIYRTYREEHSYHSSFKPKLGFHTPEQASSKYGRAVEWSRAFNRRNAWVVPDKSPISIYCKTRGKKAVR